MAVFNSLTFDGENSLDYGVYISGEAVYDAPERAVEMISIPGRNGAIALDQGRFENIDVTYPAGTFGDDQADFAAKIRKFRNLLASRYSYVRLTDSYHPDEFRLGLYKSGLNASPVQYGSAGQFPITFNCKPQRFLTSGEAEVNASEWSGAQSKSGPIVEIDNSEGEFGLKSLVADIDPIQSYNGYDKPWVGGAGKNKLNLTSITPNKAENGITFTVNADGTVKANGTATAQSQIYWNIPKTIAQTFGGMILNGCVSQAGVSIRLEDAGAPYTLYADDTGSGVTISASIASSPTDNVNLIFRVVSGTTLNNVTIKPMIRLASETDATFAPYENICPISGHTETKTYVSDGNLISARENWYTKADGVIEASALYGAVVFPVQQGETYSLLIDRNVNPNRVWAFYEEYPQVDSVSYDRSRVVAQNTTITAPINGWCLYRDLVANNIQSVVKGSTATAAEEAKAYTSELGRTVYKGTLDITTGVLTVTHGIKQFTGANQQGVLNDSYFAYDTSESPSDAAGGIYPSVYYCDSYKAVNNANERLNGTFYIINKNVVFVNDAFTSVAEANTLLASQKPTVVYPLATPLTYQLTPQEIDLLLGDNNIWANSGDVSVEYGQSPVYNPTEFDAKPLIKVVGTGTLRVGDTTVTITGTAGQTIYIDCETMEIYKLVDGAPQSAASLVSFSGNDFPVLKAGSNTVGLGTGITSVTIIPRWWII